MGSSISSVRRTWGDFVTADAYAPWREELKRWEWPDKIPEGADVLETANISSIATAFEQLFKAPADFTFLPEHTANSQKAEAFQGLAGQRGVTLQLGPVHTAVDRPVGGGWGPC